MTMQEIQEYDFGIVLGQTVKIKATGSINQGIRPWNGETFVVKITNEYPFFFSGIVYPHKYRDKNNVSNSFRISISKVDILIGDVKVTI